MQKHNQFRLQRPAFTLIEVLVTMSMIALLMSILLPCLRKARQKTQEMVCKSNLRQWGIALQYYMFEQDNYIPRRGQGIQPTTDLIRNQDWFNCLPPYVGQYAYKDMVRNNSRPLPNDRSLFICPSSTYTESTCFLPYAMNMYLSSWNRPASHNLREIRKPTITVFMADSPGPYSSTIPAAKPYSVMPRHHNKAQMVFLDGHVQSKPGDDLGCGIGLPSPQNPDVHWKTGTSSDLNVSY